MADLVRATRKGSTWVYERLRRLAGAGRASRPYAATGGPPGHPDDHAH